MNFREKQLAGHWGIVFAALVFAFPAMADDWRAYGGDDGGSHYSAHTQINKDNVGDLELAWTYQTGELEERPERKQASSLHSTPILLPDEAGGTLVFCTAFNKIVSLHPVTGEEQWAFDPEVIDFSPFAGRYNCRGIAYWEDTAAQQGQACKHRLFMGTSDLRV